LKNTIPSRVASPKNKASKLNRTNPKQNNTPNTLIDVTVRAMASCDKPKMARHDKAQRRAEREIPKMFT